MAQVNKTTTDDNGKYKIEVADSYYWKEQIKCQMGCPVHTDARGYIQAIAHGDYLRAYLIARGPNPFASICGRVCGAPCETACRRGDVDKPISIRALKRFVDDKFGPARDVSLASIDPMMSPEYVEECMSINEQALIFQAMQNMDIERVSNKKVAIIGAGPGGMSAAHDLILMGFKPTVYDVYSKPGGMMYVGVPPYRVSREMIVRECQSIIDMGVEMKYNTKVGVDITLAELRKQYDAVVIATGLHESKRLNIPGEDAIGVYGGVYFLKDLILDEGWRKENDKGYFMSNYKVGKKIITIGGGNTAYDCARSSLRIPGVEESHIYYRKGRDNMPADAVEIKEGDEEGVIRHHYLSPVEILRDEHNVVKGVRFQKMLSEKKDDFLDVECDTVLLAIGQSNNLSVFLDPERDGIKLNKWGDLEVDENLATTAPGVYAAGDIANGARLIIDAVAEGKKSARSIYQYVTGKQLKMEDLELHFDNPGFKMIKEYEKWDRVPVPDVNPDFRRGKMDIQVEIGYTEEQAQREASRCYDCGVNTIFDGELCILCGGCVDVCPTDCLKIDALESTNDDEDMGIIKDNYSSYDTAISDSKGYSVIIKDETKCIRCALCAIRCPTETITMESFNFKEAIVRA